MITRLLKLAGALLFVMTACAPDNAASLAPVTLQLNWFHQAAFAGYYVAEERGFYEEEGIAVTFRKAANGMDVPQLLADGEVDFALGAMADFKRALSLGADVKAVMALFQISPTVLFSLEGSGIEKPADMVGRRVAIKGDSWRKIIRETLRSAGVDPAGIVEVDVPFEAIELLYNGEVAVWTGYAGDEPTEARLAGYDVNLIFTAEYGRESYEDLLMVQQDVIDANPDLVAGFVRATLRGWEAAIERPDEAAALVAEWQPAHRYEFHRLALDDLIPLIDTGSVPIGWIDADRWCLIMAERCDPQDPAYTMRFVEQRE